MYTVKIISVGLCNVKQFASFKEAQKYYHSRVKLFNNLEGKNLLHWCNREKKILEIFLEENGTVLKKWALCEGITEFPSYKAVIIDKNSNDTWYLFAYFTVREAIKEAERGGEVHILSTDIVTVDTFKKLLDMAQNS